MGLNGVNEEPSIPSKWGDHAVGATHTYMARMHCCETWHMVEKLAAKQQLLASRQSAARYPPTFSIHHGVMVELDWDILHPAGCDSPDWRTNKGSRSPLRFNMKSAQLGLIR